MEHNDYVYIVASRTHVPYVGVTNSVRRRIEQHRSRDNPGFTADYRCHRLVWFERYQYIGNAINREKQIGGQRSGEICGFSHFIAVPSLFAEALLGVAAGGTVAVDADRSLEGSFGTVIVAAVG